MNEIGLILGFHLHVPPGVTSDRWDWFHAAALQPLLESLWDKPGPRVSLHLTGTTWELLAAREPSTLQALQSLVAGKQVELLGGAWSSAFLGGMPERDAMTQVQLAARQLKGLFDVMPRGAWLSQGAWDPVLPRILFREGLGHTFLPDDAFMAAGILPQELRGPVLTEREGCTLALFPLDGLMGSLIPRCPVPDLIVYLRRRAQLEFGVTSWFGDLAQLGEKTHETGLRPWMNSLLENLTENEHWLRTLFPTQALQRYQERRVVYLPSWFPPSLSECALPPGAVAQFSKIQTVPPAGWEAFLARYSEANRLHKAVLRVSREVQGMRIHLRKTGLDDQNRQSLERVTEALARAGSADGLWHSPGRWAGVYDPAIRQAAWGALLEAEKTCNQVLGTHQGVRCERGDHNGDGREEVLVHTPHCLAMVEPEAGGVLSEFSIWRQPVNVLNAITRRQELYHDRLVRDSLLPALVEKGLEGMKADTGLGMSPEDEEETASIMVVDDDEYESGRWDLGDPRWEATLGDRLQHDRGTRASFMDHFLGSETTLENLWRGQHSEEGDFVYGSYNVLKAETVGPDLVDVHMAREGLVRQVGAKGVEDRLVQVNKQYRFHGTQSRVDVRYEISNRYHSPVHSTFGVEVNLGLDGRVGDLIALELEDGRSVPVTKRGKVDGIQKVVLVDQTRGLRIVLLTRRMATLWFYPVECFVAGSGGLETVYQGQCLLFGWPVSLWGEERVRLDLALEVQI